MAGKENTQGISMVGNKKNPKMVLKWGTNGASMVRNIYYDPKKCEYCGKKHGVFQEKCKIGE